jgi:chromosome segregation ATPase
MKGKIEVLQDAIEASCQKRDEFANKLRSAINEHAEANKSGDARNMLTTSEALAQSILETTQKVAANQNLLDEYRAAIEESYGAESTANREKLGPLQEQLTEARLRLKDSEDQVAAETERIAPEAAIIDRRKNYRLEIIANTNSANRDLLDLVRLAKAAV